MESPSSIAHVGTLSAAIGKPCKTDARWSPDPLDSFGGSLSDPDDAVYKTFLVSSLKEKLESLSLVSLPESGKGPPHKFQSRFMRRDSHVSFLKRLGWGAGRVDNKFSNLKNGRLMESLQHLLRR